MLLTSLKNLSIADGERESSERRVVVGTLSTASQVSVKPSNGVGQALLPGAVHRGMCRGDVSGGNESEGQAGFKGSNEHWVDSPQRTQAGHLSQSFPGRQKHVPGGARVDVDVVVGVDIAVDTEDACQPRRTQGAY